MIVSYALILRYDAVQHLREARNSKGNVTKYKEQKKSWFIITCPCLLNESPIKFGTIRYNATNSLPSRKKKEKETVVL